MKLRHVIATFSDGEEEEEVRKEERNWMVSQGVAALMVPVRRMRVASGGRER